MSGAIKPYVPIFTITLILSAFLLFSVQPMFGKMILPLLGGTPGVWNTAMVFFQAMLLGGYAYAHLTTKYLNVRAQAVLHVILLGLCVFVLPIAIPEGWTHPPTMDNPTPWLLGLMALAVGGPFFVLAGTAPMLQRWFSTTDHPDSQNPYFLYAASNLGSMAALIGYPLVIEPLIGLHEQSHVWMYGYITLIALIAGAGLMSGRTTVAKPAYDPHQPANSTVPDNKMRLMWLLLAFIPSSLMIGVTTFITTDIASVPLIWVVPLALYLLTFIIVFSRFNRLSLARCHHWQCIAMIFVAIFLLRDITSIKMLSVIIHLTAFFLSVLTCHLALAQRKPTPQHLTEFYLIMSLGGVLGGAFNTFVAVYLFPLPLEYALMMCIALFVPVIVGQIELRKAEFVHCKNIIAMTLMAALAAFVTPNMISVATIMIVVIFMSLFLLLRYKGVFVATLVTMIALDPGYSWTQLDTTRFIERNFFGVVRVVDSDSGNARTLMHGTTLHGTQALSEKYRLSPLSYYAASSPGGQVFGILSELDQKPQNVAILGLGAGSVACFPSPDRHFTFYEIDPAILKVAMNKELFTYLSDCGSPYDVVMGDARLKMVEAPDHSFDMIFMDAFSSDSIPVHLLTKEAFDLYFRKLKPDGFIVIHISNRFMDLRPVLMAAADLMDARIWFNTNRGRVLSEANLQILPSSFGLMTRSTNVDSVIETHFTQWFQIEQTESFRPWTDDYANITSLLWRKILEPRL